MKALSSIIIAGLGFTADRVTKDLMESKPELNNTQYFDGKLRLVVHKNRGFAMNTLESNRKLVVGVSTVVFGLLLPAYVSVIANAKMKPLRLGMSLVMAGAAGNVYDRLIKGYVVDFANVSFMKKVVFNLADVLTVVGALFTLLGELAVD